MVIVDSSVWIDYFGDVRDRHTDWLDRQFGLQPIGLTDLILCEVLQGYGDEFTFARVRRALLLLHVLDAGGQHLAVSAARNYRFLRQKGHTVRKTIDCLIATFCIESGYELLHRDRDFDPFEKYLGLRVVHP
jgi:predicted nucleic acid-binding protein